MRTRLVVERWGLEGDKPDRGLHRGQNPDKPGRGEGDGNAKAEDAEDD
jgi:hypothetical protein